MERQYHELMLFWEIPKGLSINKIIAEAIEMAKEWVWPVRFVFDDVTVVVRHDSDEMLVLRDWTRASRGYIEGRRIGPDYEVELPPEVLEMEDCWNRDRRVWGK